MQLVRISHSLAPYFALAYEQYIWAHENLPIDLAVAVFGLILCFFGGMFPLVLAAYEAFKISGWDTCRAAVGDLYSQFQTYRSASKVDDEKDDDNDGVADVDQIGAKDLVARKLGLALRSCDPNKVNDALGGLSQGCVGVVATLKFKHARTVALGVSIGNQLRKPAGMYIAPLLALAFPEEHRKWIPFTIDYLCKFAAVSIAWTVQSVISTVQCAIRGGLITSRALLRYANKKGVVKIDEEDTYVDEAVGWCLAFLGVSFQLMNGLSLPFPLNVLLIPFRMGEMYLRWAISSD